MNYSLSDFDFTLPQELIAQHPAAERSASRLLVPKAASIDSSSPVVGDVQPRAHEFRDAQFKDLLELLYPGDVLVFNTSKVIPARLYATKETGGQVEILVERILSSDEATVLLRVSKKPTAGSILHAQGKVIEVLGRDPQHDDRFRLRFDSPVLDLLNEQGEIPLPPYITHKPDEEDARRYQTVYAQEPGSVAAPTAGLHFDEAMLQALDERGVHRAAVTLHVGTGTFAPVRSEKLDEHRMHSEWCEVPEATAQLIAQARRESRRVIAVGTTSLRTLESAALANQPGLIRSGSWETDIFIKPGYSFQVVDALLTNFHLPRSTLLMLVAAFVGYDRMHEIYAHAIAKRYRFFSYGDAMFLQRVTL